MSEAEIHDEIVAIEAAIANERKAAALLRLGVISAPEAIAAKRAEIDRRIAALQRAAIRLARLSAGTPPQGAQA